MAGNKKNIVIIGAGFAGIALATGFSAKIDSSQYNIVLINSRSYAIPWPASARLVVTGEPKLEETAFVKIDRLIPKGKGETKTGLVTSIEKTENGGVVVLDSGERVPYAALVLAPGSNWYGPLALPSSEKDVLPHVNEWRRKFENAKHVVLIGGGAVGIEIAGELKDFFPKKKVTIIQGDSQLLNQTYPERFRKGFEQRLRDRGVELVFNEYVDEIPSEEDLPTVGLVTRSGKRIEGADLAIFSRGPTPNTAFITSLGEDSLNSQGFVKVRPTLQLLNHDNIFAAGDVIEWKEQKQAAKTKDHASVIVANVISYLAGAPVTKEYKGSVELILITLGRNGGMGYFNFFGGIVLGDWFARWIKSKTLMVPMWRKSLNY